MNSKIQRSAPDLAASAGVQVNTGHKEPAQCFHFSNTCYGHPSCPSIDATTLDIPRARLLWAAANDWLEGYRRG